MPKTQYKWSLGNVSFHLINGDLFAVTSEAIVNSEQTDFILARRGSSISAQIHRRWGASVQDQLDDLTQGQTLPPGTVLETEANPYRCLFHAGFHHPHDWLDLDSEDSSETEHLRVIRRCIRRVLERAVASDLHSVTFPLIGTGAFKLDPHLLAYEFFDEVILFATETHLFKELTVQLVILDAAVFADVLETGVQAWVDRTASSQDWQPLRLGISYLDAFERRLASARDPHWKSFLVTQYAQLLTAYLHAVLANTATPPVNPQAMMKPGWPISFGTIRSAAMRLAQDLQGCTKTAWGRFITASLLERGQCLERINQDRNDIAHTRAVRPFAEIVSDLFQFIRVEDWHKLASREAIPSLVGLKPWIYLQNSGDGADGTNEAQHVGLLENCTNNDFLYLNPNTGSEFKCPI